VASSQYSRHHGPDYARHDGYALEVAYAVEDHYKPKFAGDCEEV
jgi:glycyl-tRNA synthetase beta subunit